MRKKIHNLGFHFDYQLKGVDAKLEELEKSNSNPSKEEFLDFISENTGWNLCDCCGRINNSIDLKWVGGDEDFFDDEYHVQSFINAYTPYEAVCDDCFEDFKELRFLSLKTIKNRLAENGKLFRAGENVFSMVSCKVFTIKHLTNEGYQVENSPIVLKEEMLFDMINFALCHEFATVIDEHTNKIDLYDELNTINHEGQLEIKSALGEFVKYL